MEKAMSKKRSLALAAMVTLLLVALPIFFFSTRPVTTSVIGLIYNLGEEIETYPIPELSTNFTSWNLMTTFQEMGFQLDPRNQFLLVLVNFTLTNTTNKTINLFDQSLSSALTSKQTPSLWYEGQTEDSKYVFALDKGVRIAGSWLDALYPDETVLATGMMNANETAKGLLIYMLPMGFRAAGLDTYYSDDLSIFVELINTNRNDQI